MKEWVHLSEDETYRRIGSDNVGDIWISTVWLGLDHNFTGTVPMIFETMVFDTRAPTEWVTDEHGERWPINHQWDDQYMRRYATEEQARCGHLATVAMYRNKT